VTSLGGEIQVESQPGAGSLLRVLLPAAPPVSTAASASSGPNEKSPRQGRVLLIDDQPDLCSVLGRFLSAKFHVASTTDAAQGLDMIGSGARFDLILCDLVMHGVSGIDFYERLLMRHPGLARRILFMTGGAFTAQDADFLRVIENPVIEKPVLPQVLSERISSLLREWGTYQDEEN
jgi:CheY-like chemotaxis protein